MKHKIFGAIVAVLSLSNTYGQKDRYLSIEAGGVGGFGSFNFEKSFYQKEKLNLIFRTGFSVSPFGSSSGVVLIFPVMIHAVIGQTNHKLDLGIGQAPSATLPVSGVFARMPLNIGYKYEPQDKNHYWRVSYTPLVSYLVQFQWEHWAGITYGYKLKTKDK